jgi:hypothetical protein
MSGPVERKQAEGRRQEHAALDRNLAQAARLRSQAAEAARSVAATEDRLADTFEAIAEHRSPQDAQRLRALADEARDQAVKERDLSVKYSRGGGDESQAEEG